MDRHRRFNEEKFQEGKPVLVFQTRSGLMPGKLRLRWVGPYWIVGGKDGTYVLGTLSGERLAQPVNGFRMKPYYGKMPPNPFLKEVQTDSMEPTQRETTLMRITVRRHGKHSTTVWRHIKSSITETFRSNPEGVCR